MSKSATKGAIKIDNYTGALGKWSGVQFSFGKVALAEEEDWEPMGPTPKPQIPDLRSWFMTLMKRYKPFYAPISDRCELCTFGPCNLVGTRHGACGISQAAANAKIVQAACDIGAACHSSHGIHLLHWVKEKFGNLPIDFGSDIAVEAPVTRCIVGMKPKTLEDLEEAQEWVTEVITHTLSAAHTGQEGSYLDYESKAFVAGLCDGVGMEAADIAQIIAYGMPKGDADAPLVDIGMGTLDKNKPVILMIGHNVAPGIEIVDYLREKGLEEQVDIGAICCTAHDLTRYYEGAKVVGTISKQLRYIRSGVPDVVMVDEQCINLLTFEEAKKIGAAFIATNEKCMMGLPDRTNDPIDAIVRDLVDQNADGVLILNPTKAGTVAVEAARQIHPIRQNRASIPSEEEMIQMAHQCVACYNCVRACPNDLPLVDCILEVREQHSFEKAAKVIHECVGCGRCEEECMRGVKPHLLLTYAAQAYITNEKWRMRSGRGPIKDVEIRNVGAPIVLGEIPGVIAIVGCSNYSKRFDEVAKIAEEFLKRNFIVLVSGCAAMDIAMYDAGDGKSLYELYGGAFDRGCLVNVGSCVSNAHITGAVYKVANIFARRPLRGNFEEIADYALHRIGAVGLAWGAYSQKAASIAAHVNGSGIPVVIGPHTAEYRRIYLSRTDKPEDWQVFNARDGSYPHEIEPCPEHLLAIAESMEECIVMLAKLCLRPADSIKGRNIKLSHWIDLSKKYLGLMPGAEELAKFVRVEADIPISIKSEIVEMLESVGWQPREIIDPTLVERTCHKAK